MTWLTLGQLLGGLVLLVLGGEGLVRGASGIAARAGMPPWLVGLTIVAFGTSAPELAVSVQGAATGRPDLAVGNVLGSNTFNVLGILGLSSLFGPLIVARSLVRWDIPLMIAVTALTWLLARDGLLGAWDGGALLLLLVTWVVTSVVLARRESAASEPVAGELPPLAPRLVEVIGGLGLLVVGSRLLVDGATDVARTLGWSELVIGLTVVAVGTSLPEVAASLTAAARGERDIAVGNVVGSNLFNLLGVLGTSAMVAPGGLPASAGVLSIDLPVAFLASAACLPIFAATARLTWKEGVLMAGWYALYVGMLVLDATDHPAHEAYTEALLYGVLPLTLVLLAGFVVDGVRRRGSA